MDEDLDVDVHDVRDRPHLGGTEIPLEIDRVDRKVEHGDLEVVGAAVGSEGVPDGALACRRHAEGVLGNPTRCRDDVEWDQQVHTETWRRSCPKPFFDPRIPGGPKPLSRRTGRVYQ